MRTSDNTPIRHTSLRASPRTSRRRFLRCLSCVTPQKRRFFSSYAFTLASSASSASVTPPAPPRRPAAMGAAERAPQSWAAHPGTLQSYFSLPWGHDGRRRRRLAPLGGGQAAAFRAVRLHLAAGARAARREVATSPCRAGGTVVDALAPHPAMRGSRCTRRSCSAACRVRTRRTSRSSPFADRAGTARAPTPSRERGLAPRVTFGRTQGGASWLRALLSAFSRKVKRRDAASRLLHAPNSPRGTTHRHASLARVFAHRSDSNTMVAASGPRVAKGIVALLAIALGAASGETLRPFPGSSPKSRRVEPRRHVPFEELEAHRRPAHLAGGRRPCARACPTRAAVRHRGGTCISAGAREVRARRVRRKRADLVETTRAARHSRARVRGRQDCLGARVRDCASTPSARCSPARVGAQHTRDGHYTHYTSAPVDGGRWWWLRARRCRRRFGARAEDASAACCAPTAIARVRQALLDVLFARRLPKRATRRRSRLVLPMRSTGTAGGGARALGGRSHRLGAPRNPRARVRRAARARNGARRRECASETHGGAERWKSSPTTLERLTRRSIAAEGSLENTHERCGRRTRRRGGTRARHASCSARTLEERGKKTWVKNRKTHFLPTVAHGGFIRAARRRAVGDSRGTVRSSSFAWHVVMWAYVVLARVVPARYRVAAGRGRRRLERAGGRARSPQPLLRGELERLRSSRPCSEARRAFRLTPFLRSPTRCGAKPPLMSRARRAGARAFARRKNVSKKLELKQHPCRRHPEFAKTGTGAEEEPISAELTMRTPRDARRREKMHL